MSDLSHFVYLTAKKIPNCTFSSRISILCSVVSITNLISFLFRLEIEADFIISFIFLIYVSQRIGWEALSLINRNHPIFFSS